MQKRMNIILVTLDCVRREALSCYGEGFKWYQGLPGKARTPNIDQIAQDGATFTEAICQAPFTPASHASILTGLNPYDHGIREIVGSRLSEGVRTLAEVLRDHGYRTGAFIGSHALRSEFGLDRGFDVYDENFENRSENWILGYRRPAWENTDRALAWLGQDGGKSFFLFLHYFDAHDAVGASSRHDESEEVLSGAKRSAKRWASLLRLWHQRIGSPLSIIRRLWEPLANRRVYGRRFHIGKAREIDAQIGRVLDFLRKGQLYDQTVIVIMADHGDSFGEHGEFSHREYLYDTTLRVPLIIKPVPHLSGKTVPWLVRSIDVYPTVLDILGISGAGNACAAVQGVSLIGLLNGQAQGDLHAYGETRHEASADDLGTLKSHLVSLRTSSWKLIVDLLRGEEELYDLKVDPGERKNLRNQEHEIGGQLRMELQELMDNAGLQEPNRMSLEDIEIIEERLKGLGYF